MEFTIYDEENGEAAWSLPEPKLFVPAVPKRGIFEIQPVLNMIDGLGIVCGGYARYVLSPNPNTPKAGDLDLYVYQPGMEVELTNKLVASNLFSKIFETPRAITFRKRTDANWFGPDRLQIIKPVQEGRLLTYGTVEDILGNFDFSVARAAIDAKGNGTVDFDFDEGETDQELRIKKIQCPISSTLRIAKYTAKGYKVHSREVFKLFQEWNNRGPEWQTSITKEFEELARLEAELELNATSENQERIDGHLTALYDRLSID